MELDEVQRVFAQHPDQKKLEEALKVVAKVNYHSGYVTGYNNAVTCQVVVPVNGGGGRAA